MDSLLPSYVRWVQKRSLLQPSKLVAEAWLALLPSCISKQPSPWKGREEAFHGGAAGSHMLAVASRWCPSFPSENGRCFLPRCECKLADRLGAVVCTNVCLVSLSGLTPKATTIRSWHRVSLCRPFGLLAWGACMGMDLERHVHTTDETATAPRHRLARDGRRRALQSRWPHPMPPSPLLSSHPPPFSPSTLPPQSIPMLSGILNLVTHLSLSSPESYLCQTLHAQLTTLLAWGKHHNHTSSTSGPFTCRSDLTGCRFSTAVCNSDCNYSDHMKFLRREETSHRYRPYKILKLLIRVSILTLKSMICSEEFNSLTLIKIDGTERRWVLGKDIVAFQIIAC
ncbi:unnamed protein product [Musa textilis]